MQAAEETRCQKVGCGAAACTLVFQLRDHLERAQEHKAAKPSVCLDCGSLFQIASVSARAFAARQRPWQHQAMLQASTPHFPTKQRKSRPLHASGNQSLHLRATRLKHRAHFSELGGALCRPAAGSPVVQRHWHRGPQVFATAADTLLSICYFLPIVSSLI